jgi:hypothetical protein
MSEAHEVSQTKPERQEAPPRFRHSSEVEREHQARTDALATKYEGQRLAVQVEAAKEVGPAAVTRDGKVKVLRATRDTALSRLNQEEMQAWKRAKQQIKSEYENKRSEVTRAFETARAEAQAACDAVINEVTPRLQAKVAGIAREYADEMNALDAWFEETVKPLRAAEAKAREAAEAEHAAAERAAAEAQENAKQVAAQAAASATASSAP